MNNIQHIIHSAKTVLTPITDTPVLETEILLAHVLKKTRSYLLAHGDRALPSAAIQQFNVLLKRRQQGEPIAYIIGKKEFWSLELVVSQDVLIPRPETEQLVELILTLKKNASTIKLADLGTGSGAIALALAKERPHWQVYATDISPFALTIAAYNAQQLALTNLSFYAGNWTAALPVTDFDVIVSNPPYIAASEWESSASQLAYEPYRALVSGIDGLEAIRQLIYDAKNYLKPNGCFFIEHGFNQGSAVRALFQAAHYVYYDTVKDLAGHDRITWGRIFS